MREIRFTAFGKPQPQGSKNAFKTGNRVVLVEASKGLKPWRSVVALEAKKAMSSAENVEPIAGAVMVDIVFQFEPGKTVKRKEMTTKPDIDKTCRAILDAVTGICFRDDAQVVELRAAKRYGSMNLVQVVVIEL